MTSSKLKKIEEQLQTIDQKFKTLSFTQSSLSSRKQNKPSHTNLDSSPADFKTYLAYKKIQELKRTHLKVSAKLTLQKKKQKAKLISYTVLLAFLTLFVFYFLISEPTLTGAAIGKTSNGGSVPIGILAAPTHATPLLNTSGATNSSTLNLICLNQSTADSDGDSVKNIFNWYHNNKSVTILNLPFENNTANIATTTRDYSNYSLNGTITSATFNSTGGYDGTGTYYFDDIDDFISITNSPELNFRTNFSISFWIKSIGTIGSFDSPLMKTSSGSWNDGYGFYYTGGTTLGFWVDSYSTNIATATLTPTQWNHIIGTYDGLNVRIFVNGIEGTPDTYSSLLTTSSAPLEIGRGVGGYYVNAYIDEVTFVNRSLSFEQIQNMYNNKTNQIHTQELKIGDDWKCEVTPNDGKSDGITKLSNNLVTIQNNNPQIHSVNFQSGTLGNSTYKNLTATVTSSDLDNETIVPLFDWYLNDSSIFLLNLPFEFPSNNTISLDFSPYQQNATVSGPIHVRNESKKGGYYKFNGNPDEISIPDNDRLDFGENKTLTFWLKLASTTESQHVIGKVKNSGTFEGCIVRTSSQISFECYSSSGTQDVELTASGLTSNIWYFVTVSFYTSNVTLYVDGVYKTSDSTYQKVYNSDTPFKIGEHGSGWTGDPFRGMIDDIQLWNRSLTAEQVYSLSQNKSIIVSEETAVGNRWQTRTMVFDGGGNSTKMNSSIITITNNNPPTQSVPVLNSTFGTNAASENLTVYNISTTDIDGDRTKNIINWKYNSTNFENVILPFETGSNATFTKDYSWYLNNGTVTGATWLPNGGYDGFGAYDFDGTDDYISLGNGANVALTDNISISFWTKNDVSPASYDSLMAKTTSGSWNDGYGFYYLSSTSIGFWVADYNKAATATITPTQWNHIIGTYDGTTVRIFVNGVEGTPFSYSGSITSTSTAFELGGSSTTAYNIDGKIDDLRLYNFNLSSDERVNLYTNLTNTTFSPRFINGQKWQSCITPHDQYDSGSQSCSNNITIGVGAENTPPGITAFSLNPDPGYENTTFSISTTYTDVDSNLGTIYFTWYVNSTPILNQTNTSIATGSSVTTTLNGTYFNHHNIVNLTAYAYDGTVNSTPQWSNQVTINNFIPIMPTLLALNGTTITNRTPALTWNNSIDIDNPADTITYHLLIDDNSAFNNPEVNVSSIAQGTPNTSTNTTTELDIDKIYYWKVRAFDGFNYSNDSATFNFTLNSYLALSVLRSNVNFTVLAPGSKANTTNNSYAPFLLENIGNINSNLTVTTGNYFFTAINASSLYYQFNIEANETNAFNTTASQISWANISLTSVISHAIDWNYHHWKNDLIVNLLVQVPPNETSGTKNSTISFVVS